MAYEGFEETGFLKKIITSDDSSFNVAGKDYYQVLNLKGEIGEVLNKELTDKDNKNTKAYTTIRKAFMKESVKYHPDKNLGKEAEVAPKFNLINEA
jgi:hypothetical protein